MAKIIGDTTTTPYDITELKLRDERLKYYGDTNIVPTDESLFNFIRVYNNAYISLKDKNIIGDIVIPYKYTIDGIEYTVTGIDSQGFYHASNITKIIMPNTIVSIGTGAFDGCTSLTDIAISNNIDYLGGVIFSGCSNLTNINIHDGVTAIEYRCFRNCTNLKRVTIPSSVIYIDEEAFSGCDNLTITCAEGSRADTFAKEHRIPVEYTNEVTKGYVDKLNLHDERLKYYGDPDIVPTEDSFFEFTTDDETMTAVARILYNKKIEELVIPYEYVIEDKVYSIIRLVYTDTYESYQNKSSVKKVIIPNADILYIGDMVFDSTSITGIDIPECVSSISGQTFINCRDLTKITLSKNISYIANIAFDGCDNLTIVCAEGSYADTYAQENGIKVEYTDEVTKGYVDNKLSEMGGSTSLSASITDGVFFLTSLGGSKYTSSIVDGVLKIA